MTFLGNLLLVLRLVKANMYHQHTSNAASELAHVRAHSKSILFCSAKLTDAPRCIMGRKHPILQEGPTKLLCPPACTWRRRLHTGPASHVRALQEHKRGPQRSGHIHPLQDPQVAAHEGFQGYPQGLHNNSRRLENRLLAGDQRRRGRRRSCFSGAAAHHRRISGVPGVTLPHGVPLPGRRFPPRWDGRAVLRSPGQTLWGLRFRHFATLSIS